MDSIFDVCGSDPEEVKFKSALNAEMLRVQTERELIAQDWAEEIGGMLNLVRFVQSRIDDRASRKACTANLEVLAERLQNLARQ